MINQIYAICETSNNIMRDITLLFNQNKCEFFDERGFSSKAAESLYNAFKDVKGANVAFASTLKPNSDGVNCSAGYGEIYIELPFSVQEEIMDEIASQSLMALNRPMCFQYQNQCGRFLTNHQVSSDLPTKERAVFTN